MEPILWDVTPRWNPKTLNTKGEQKKNQPTNTFLLQNSYAFPLISALSLVNYWIILLHQDSETIQITQWKTITLWLSCSQLAEVGNLWWRAARRQFFVFSQRGWSEAWMLKMTPFSQCHKIHTKYTSYTTYSIIFLELATWWQNTSDHGDENSVYLVCLVPTAFIY